MDSEVEIKEEPVWHEETGNPSCENFELESSLTCLKEEIKPELTEPGPTQPAAIIKDEIIVEEQTVDQLVPCFKKESSCSLTLLARVEDSSSTSRWILLLQYSS
ncbi:uncharacterized protein [Anabrus simplex]|uniref:uncharacterized protein isoform X2 n=1 Tax=Anabrus simplex TaxID=316456 RepID=UPI0035A2EE7F